MPSSRSPDESAAATDPDNTEDGEGAEDDEDEDWMAGRGVVTIRVPESLTQTERKIVRSWFRYGEAVRFYPWDESRGVTNGRHRLWGTLQHFNGAMVPVVSDALAYANPQDAGTITDWASLYREDLDQLHAARWFDAADPLNQQYVTAMETTAGGEFPAERTHMNTGHRPGTKTYRDHGATSIYADEVVWDDVTDYNRLMQAMFARIMSTDLRSVLFGYIAGVSLDATLVNAGPGDADAAAGAANGVRWLERALTSDPVDPLPETEDELAQLRARKRAERTDDIG